MPQDWKSVPRTHRDVAGILVDDLAAGFALLLQAPRATESTEVRSWTMIDAEMYGMMLSAKIAMRSTAPPAEHVEQAENAVRTDLLEMLWAIGLRC